MPEDEETTGGILNRLRSRYAVRIGLVVLVVAVVLAGIGFFAFTSVQGSVQDDAEETLKNAAEREAAGIEEFNQNRIGDVRRISNESLTAREASEVNDQLGAERDRLPDSVAAIHLFNIESNTVEASSALESQGSVIEEEDRPWAAPSDRLLRVDDYFTFGPYEVNGQQRLAFVSYVDDGNQNHVIVLAVSLESRSDLLEGPLEDSAVEVIDHRGDQIVLSQDLTRLSQTPELQSELEYLDRKQGETRVDTVSADHPLIDDGNLVVATAPVEGVPWSVVVVASEDSALATVSDVTQNLLLLIGVALLGLLVVGAVITRDINKALSKTTGYASEIEQGNLNVEIDQSRKDEFGQLSGQFARLRDALQDQIRSSEQARKEAEVARAEAEELAEYLRDKAEEYSEVMQEVGAGNLTWRMEQDGEEESMDRIAEEFNDMIEELEKTTGQLKSYVNEVEESGAEVEQSAMTVREASEQVADSIQKISDDAHEQKERLESISEAMDEVAAELETLSTERDVSMDRPLGTIRDASTELDAVATLTEETMAESEEVAGAAEEQAAELNTVSERAHDLQQYTQPLRDILERFETEKEHEFVFSVGPTGGARSPETGPGDQPEGDETTED
jgi:methyl-accepting chemotaxis protein